jgi:tetratricopeptide (TPR) repeat protein
MKKGDYDRAIAEQTKALEINSTTPEAYSYYFNRASAYLKAGKATQGLSDTERALQLSPNSAFALNARGQILGALGRRQDAIADFRKALAIDPNIEDSRDGLRRLGATP